VQGYLTPRFQGFAGCRAIRVGAPASNYGSTGNRHRDLQLTGRTAPTWTAMAPGVADAIARGAAAFKPSYVVAKTPGALRDVTLEIQADRRIGHRRARCCYLFSNSP